MIDKVYLLIKVGWWQAPYLSPGVVICFEQGGEARYRILTNGGGLGHSDSQDACIYCISQTITLNLGYPGWRAKNLISPAAPSLEDQTSLTEFFKNTDNEKNLLPDHTRPLLPDQLILYIIL